MKKFVIFTKKKICSGAGVKVQVDCRPRGQTEREAKITASADQKSRKRRMGRGGLMSKHMGLGNPYFYVLFFVCLLVL